MMRCLSVFSKRRLCHFANYLTYFRQHYLHSWPSSLTAAASHQRHCNLQVLVFEQTFETGAASATTGGKDMQMAATEAFMAGIGCPILWAQQPAFEVATVKVNRTGSSHSSFPELRNGRLAAENVSLKSL